MTNPKTRKTGRDAPGGVRRGARAVRSAEEVERGGEEEEQCIVPAWVQSVEDPGDDSGSLITAIATDAAAEGDAELYQLDEEEEEEDDVNSDSSFSLEECINEFHARRIRRVSTQSREAAQHAEECVRAIKPVVGESYMDPADADLINQNRSNKEHERKCKPCKNGFCYCFTSDSGDGSGCAAARGTHVRQPRRSRKSESSQVSHMHPLHNIGEKTRQSAPGNLKSPQKLQKQTQTVQQKQEKQSHAKKITPITSHVNAGQEQLTAISRLETTSADAPLIHIIQELHDNCVISEVRVNKHKIRAQQQSRSLSVKPSPKKTHFLCDTQTHTASATEQYVCTPPLKQSSPSAPTLEQISEFDSTPPACDDDDGFVYCSPLNSSSKSNDSSRRKHKAAGRLLQKRLTHSHHIQFKPRNLAEPPPKPPRSSLSWEDKLSVSTLASTSPSVREAERIVDDFLRSKGVQVPGEQVQQKFAGNAKKNAKFETTPTSQEMAKREKRKSYPMTRVNEKLRDRKPQPSCPSLSDIERVVNSKKPSNYEKNIRQHAAAPEKPVKEYSIGWKEPKITEMLNYNNNGNHKQFKSQGVQAEPQSNIGWQIPPKVDLDTVDGGLQHNLASNMEQKHTPVKTRLFTAHKSKARDSHKFILGEQLRNLSPWHSKRQRPAKSNLKSTSSTRCFLNNSKKKILRLVSPKKDNKESRNFEIRKTPLRSVGVQTSQEDLRPYENSSTPQSPPGSYHSAVQTSEQSTSIPSSQSQRVTPTSHFDFTRTVLSPPKKAPRATQRRLNFPLNRVGACAATAGDAETGLSGALKAAAMTKTYRSFHSDLDQDVTLSKMGYILGNIRAKLEASDEHAIRTFQEIERREQQSAGFDCTDGTRSRHETRLHLNHKVALRRPRHELELQEPIYSEIEDDSIHISGSPQFDNTTCIQHFCAERNPEALYAKVQKIQKTPKVHVDTTPTPLGKFLHESLRNMSITPTKPLPPEPISSDVSYNSPQSHNTSSHVSDKLQHCHSLNNIRVMEHHSPPKKHRNLSKSDLSLQRSEMFLENLCRSELIMESGELERMEKVENGNSNQNYAYLANAANTSTCCSLSDDSVSYELPKNDDENEADAAVENTSNAAGSQLGLNAIALPHTHNQSTPKKQTFLTKLFLDEQRQQLHVDIGSNAQDVAHVSPLQHNQSNSCPTTPRKLPAIPSELEEGSLHAVSLNEVYAYDRRSNNAEQLNEFVRNSNNVTHTSTWSRYKRLKDALRKSLRKSKHFVRNESKRLSTSLNLSSPHSAATTQGSSRTHNQSSDPHACCSGSSFNLDMLFALDDERAPVQQQLAKAVSICRQLPDLEISPEMVEAERLLLFSTLRRQASRHKLALVPMRGLEQEEAQRTRRYFIDAMRLPVRANASQDIFFNYFYICTFECGGVIRSTQSVECHNFEAIFRDCGIEFAGSSNEFQSADEEQVVVQCQIFMLRLRKVSTLSLEPRKAILKLPDILTPSPTSSSSSSEEIVSRFRLHATFTLNARNFAPYEYVECASKHSGQLCLRASRSCSIPLTRSSKSTNLAKEIVLTGRAEVRFPKQRYSGFLNVQDPHSIHNWNRRWCTLEGLQLRVWQDEQQLQQQPLLSLDLLASEQVAPLTAAPRELCARPRCFCLQCSTTNAGEVATTAVFFAADTQPDLSAWLQHLNAVLEFVAKWMQ